MHKPRPNKQSHRHRRRHRSHPHRLRYRLSRLQGLRHPDPESYQRDLQALLESLSPEPMPHLDQSVKLLNRAKKGARLPPKRLRKMAPTE